MATLNTYAGDVVEVNPDQVAMVEEYAHWDHDLVLPDELMTTNPSGAPEPKNDEDSLAKIAALRTSPRVLVGLVNGRSYEVTGTLDDVRQTLGIGGRQ